MGTKFSGSNAAPEKSSPEKSSPEKSSRFLSRKSVPVPSPGSAKLVHQNQKMRGQSGKKIANKSRNSCIVNSRSCGWTGHEIRCVPLAHRKAQQPVDNYVFWVRCRIQGSWTQRTNWSLRLVRAGPNFLGPTFVPTSKNPASLPGDRKTEAPRAPNRQCSGMTDFKHGHGTQRCASSQHYPQLTQGANVPNAHPFFSFFHVRKQRGSNASRLKCSRASNFCDFYYLLPPSSVPSRPTVRRSLPPNAPLHIWGA